MLAGAVRKIHQCPRGVDCSSNLVPTLAIVCRRSDVCCVKKYYTITGSDFFGGTHPSMTLVFKSILIISSFFLIDIFWSFSLQSILIL